MLRKTYKEHITIEAERGEDFDRLLNEAVQKHAEQNVEVIYKMNADGHCAYVTFDCKINIPETIADEYELQGICLNCGDCPLFKLPNDKRIKYIRCDEGGYRKRASFERKACDWLYEAVRNGEIKIGSEPKYDPRL